LAEKKGVDYEKTFEYQRRLANAQVMKKKSLRKGKATRNYDKKKTKRTHPSVNSATGFPKTQQDDISRQSSLLNAENPGQFPIESDRSYESGASEEEFKSSVGSRGNFEKLIEYKNSNAKTPLKRRGSTVSNFAHLGTLRSNEFWLQPVSNTEKFPVPVTVEIDRFMLNYLEQPEIVSSRSTATVQDDKDDSEESQTLGDNSQSSQESGSNESSFTSSSSSEGEEQKDAENNLQDQDQEPRRSPPNFKITEFTEEDQKITKSQQDYPEDENLEQNLSDDENDNMRGALERKSSGDSNQPRDRLLDGAKADLETIEERHEEDAEANTRGDLDSNDVGKRRHMKTGTITNGKGFSLFRKKPSFEEEAGKASSIQIQSQTQTENLAVHSNPSAAGSLTQIKKDTPSIASDEKLLKEEEKEIPVVTDSNNQAE